MHDPVCVCLMTHIDNRCIYAILPRAYCCTEGDPEGKGWCYFEGDTSRYHSITYHECYGKWVKVFDHTRGDKIFYCKPHLPDGTKFELNDIKNGSTRMGGRERNACIKDKEGLALTTRLCFGYASRVDTAMVRRGLGGPNSKAFSRRSFVERLFYWLNEMGTCSTYPSASLRLWDGLAGHRKMRWYL